jgi:hypothetical protein
MFDYDYIFSVTASIYIKVEIILYMNLVKYVSNGN